MYDDMSVTLDDKHPSYSTVKNCVTRLHIPRKIGHIIHKILDIRKLSAKWVPKCLNPDQKHDRGACFTSHFGLISAESRGTFELSHNYG
jgi:hypothetical protein